MNETSFIETQFPIARLSAESYKERKANLGQTLTRLGKWWGRKPLVLVRACILGMLMPAGEDPQRDREVFLKLMTMDDEGTWRRRKATLKDADLLAEATREQRESWEAARDSEDDDAIAELRIAILDGLDDQGRSRVELKRRFTLSRQQFDALPYDQRIKHCVRPEHIDGPAADDWKTINDHLGTTATSLAELIDQLGHRRFGHRPRVGDSFCGGGSIPFEAARIGCDTYGSDLNPVAALLTWADLNLIGGGRDVQEQIRGAQQAAFDRVEAKIRAWGIEHDQRGWRAEAYLYCVEVTPPGCDYAIPLAPSWLIGERTGVIGKLVKTRDPARLDIEIIEQPTEGDRKRAAQGSKVGGSGTVRDGRVIDPFDENRSWAIEELRGPTGLRMWSAEDVVPRPTDTLQERLYCIRWVSPDGTRVYASPTAQDLARERRVLDLLAERLPLWQRAGIVPSRAIPGDGLKTSEPIRTRGWTHWHHLFTPRQLLVNGLLASEMAATDDKRLRVASMLGVGRLANWNSRLCRWLSDKANEKGADVFSNQALNPLFNFSVRPLKKLITAWPLFDDFVDGIETRDARIEIRDAREDIGQSDLWITDPPYADAVNYHELADFFLAWYEGMLPKTFPSWATDGRKALAVRGTGMDFKTSMVEVYSNLARHMPDNGMQMVQFTHQDPAVWADLGMILWASGLRVTSAWTIATETPTGGIRKGNYVQGTVLLVLRKRLVLEHGFLDEVYPLVEDEVRKQIDSMRALDERGEPNFGDTDYQLAAYAAALRVLTQYQTLDGQDVGHELFRVHDGPKVARRKAAATSKSQFEQVIERGIQIACDYLVPRGLEVVWQSLTGDERLYLRALDVESRGERRQGVYQELARGFGVREVKPLLHSTNANGARVRTATEFGRHELDGEGFARTKVRQTLFAIFTAGKDESIEAGVSYLKETLRDYWGDRQRIMSILDWISSFARVDAMGHWSADAEIARLLFGRLRADHG